MPARTVLTLSERMDASAYRPVELASETPPLLVARHASDAFERAINRIDPKYTASIAQLERPAPNQSRSPAMVGIVAIAISSTVL